MNILLYRLLILILVIFYFSGCRKTEITDLNRDLLHDMFTEFTPPDNAEQSSGLIQGVSIFQVMMLRLFR